MRSLDYSTTKSFRPSNLVRLPFLAIIFISMLLLVSKAIASDMDIYKITNYDGPKPLVVLALDRNLAKGMDPALWGDDVCGNIFLMGPAYANNENCTSVWNQLLTPYFVHKTGKSEKYFNQTRGYLFKGGDRSALKQKVRNLIDDQAPLIRIERDDVTQMVLRRLLQQFIGTRVIVITSNDNTCMTLNSNATVFQKSHIKNYDSYKDIEAYRDSHPAETVVKWPDYKPPYCSNGAYILLGATPVKKKGTNTPDNIAQTLFKRLSDGGDYQVSELRPDPPKAPWSLRDKRDNKSRIEEPGGKVPEDRIREEQASVFIDKFVIVTPPFQGKEIYYELFLYLKGEKPLNGPLTADNLIPPRNVDWNNDLNSYTGPGHDWVSGNNSNFDEGRVYQNYNSSPYKKETGELGPIFKLKDKVKYKSPFEGVKKSKLSCMPPIKVYNLMYTKRKFDSDSDAYITGKKARPPFPGNQNDTWVKMRKNFSEEGFKYDGQKYFVESRFIVAHQGDNFKPTVLMDMPGTGGFPGTSKTVAINNINPLPEPHLKGAYSLAGPQIVYETKSPAVVDDLYIGLFHIPEDDNKYLWQGNLRKMQVGDEIPYKKIYDDGAVSNLPDPAMSNSAGSQTVYYEASDHTIEALNVSSNVIDDLHCKSEDDDEDEEGDDCNTIFQDVSKRLVARSIAWARGYNSEENYDADAHAKKVVVKSSEDTGSRELFTMRLTNEYAWAADARFDKPMYHSWNKAVGSPWGWHPCYWGKYKCYENMLQASLKPDFCKYNFSFYDAVGGSEHISSVICDITGIKKDDVSGDRLIPVQDVNYPRRKSRFGAVVHSKPLAIDYGASNGQSDVRVFLGTRQGFLRQFKSSSTGNLSAIWKFAPRTSIDSWPTQMNGTDVPGVDGPAVAWVHDANNNGVIKQGECKTGATTGVSACDHVYLYFGMRRGGKAYYALDVTNPDSKPELLWRITPDTTGFGELGMTFSVPRISQVNYKAMSDTEPKNHTVLIFGGGYDKSYDDGKHPNISLGNAVYVVNPKTGDLVRKFTGNVDVGNMTDPIPSTVATVRDGVKGSVSRFYVGDLGGKVWRGDMSSTDPDKWTMTRIANLGRHNSSAVGDGSDDRRFFNRPDVVKVSSKKDASFYAVILGSGNRANPTKKAADSDSKTKDQPVTNHLYVIPDSYKGTKDYWSIALSRDGEKFMSTPTTYNGTVLITSYTPEDGGICTPVGSNRIYKIPLIKDGQFNPHIKTYKKIEQAGIPGGLTYVGSGRFMLSSGSILDMNNVDIQRTSWRRRNPNEPTLEQ